MQLLTSLLQSPTDRGGGGLGLLAQVGGPGLFSAMPTIFMVFLLLFFLVFIIVIASVVVRMFKGLAEWSDNNQQPVLTVSARMVTKRTALAFYSNGVTGDNNFSQRSSTSYFVTFEFASGDRKEFKVTASQYGLLAENDTGELRFQGTRYHGFKRTTTGDIPSAQDREPTANAGVFCPYCGAPGSGDFKFCPRCGQPQPAEAAKT